MSQKIAFICVDDERNIIDVLRDQLRRHFLSVHVEIAESGEEGLEIFQELKDEGYDVPVVISDQLMPGMRGEEFLAKLSALDATTKTIMLTGQASADAVGNAVNNANLYRYIAKPWVEEDLVQTAQTALESWRQNRRLEQQERELRENHESALRFVPHEFLRLLGKERITDIKYGDYTILKVTSLLVDIRGYTSKVKSLSSEKAFSLVNEYLHLADDIVTKNHGFIANVEGDAVLAIFPNSPDQAVHTAKELMNSLTQRNQGLDAVHQITVGAGIATGEVLLGTVGSETRIQGDVIGDAINLSARLEAQTKNYDFPILICQQTHDNVIADNGGVLADSIVIRGMERKENFYGVKVSAE